MPSLKQLHYLVALYEYQHFAHAASACHVSQSTLSAAIINLEEILEAQLLERDHKRFMFTPLGEEVVERSKKIIIDSEALVDHAKYQGQPMRGVLRVGIIPTIAPFIVTELHEKINQAYPDLSLFIREDTTDNAIKYLNEGKLDIVILALPYTTAGFQTKILCKDYFQLVLPKKWANYGYEKEISNIPENSLFLLEKEHCLTGHALQACQFEYSNKINSFFATSLQTLVKMVEHLPGVTFLPTLAIKSEIIAHTNLVAKKLINDNAYREIGIMWRTTSYKKQSYLILAEVIKGLLNKKIY